MGRDTGLGSSVELVVRAKYGLRCLYLFCWMISPGCQTPDQKDPFNVLFILVDDLGHRDLSTTGSTYYQTPNVDAIAKEAMIFTQGYAGSRVCSPSRATIMTGKFTARHGITDWIGAKSGEDWRTHHRHDKLLPAEYEHQLAPQEVTIAEELKANGYKTFYAGKWHLGNLGSYPENHGFDINKGGWEKGSPIGGYFSPWENPKLENREDGENLSIRLAEETAAFIRENKDSLFFAVLSFYAVHGPIQTSRGKWAKYRQKAEDAGIESVGYRMERVLPIRQVQDNPIYGGLVETMDDAVGVVLDEIKRLGLDRNTIIIFTSDNGGVASGDNFSTTNLPLRGGKGYQWEGGLRVPYFIKVPEMAAGKSDYPVTGADFYPTILDLLDLELNPEQHLDGTSLKSIIEGTGHPDSRPLFWHYPHYGNQGGEPSSVIQEGHWKLIHYWEDERDELYYLLSDIHEDQNVLDQHPEVAARLIDQLQRYLSELNANLPSLDTEYDSVQALTRRKYLVEELWPELEARRKVFLAQDFEPDSTWWGSEPVIAN